jgi:hypothetical protein
MSTHGVEALLMGGQACVLYGAAEFSRDADFAILASRENFERLQNALDELQARVIAVPPFEPEYLERGHAVHFRCHHQEAERFRYPPSHSTVLRMPSDKETVTSYPV